MRVFDLVQGREVELPKEIEPGRFRLPNATVLNERIELEAGTLLWWPGVDRCDLTVRGKIERERHVFIVSRAEREGDFDLVNRSIEAVVDAILEGKEGGGLPSPVMPGELKELAALTKVERQLIEDIAHLFNINQSPRMSMRYDSELLSTARVQRLAPGALPRLAAHSEDWYRRDFKGVTPRRLLAEVSEDELKTYENVVYARLLDKLYKLLGRRVRDLGSLKSRRTAALSIGNAEHLEHRLRHRLCSLWGQSFAQDDGSNELADQVLADLTGLLRKIQTLRRERVYQGIPREAWVPLVLRVTNVLLHDQNYKRLRPLWRLAHGTAGEQDRDGKLKVEIGEKRYQKYRKYLGLLIQHALRSSKLLLPSGIPLRYTFGHMKLNVHEAAMGDWQLLLDGPGLNTNRTLSFVPLWMGQSEWQVGNEERQLVFCHARQSEVIADSDWGTGENSVLNPLQFYSVERVQLRIEEWLLSCLSTVYPMAASPLAGNLQARLTEVFPGTFAPCKGGAMALKHIPLNQKATLPRLMDDAKASDQSKLAIESSLSVATLMSTCKACGAILDARAIDADSYGYQATCSCGYGWRWRFHSEQRKRIGHYAYGAEQGLFESNGADEIALEVYC